VRIAFLKNTKHIMDRAEKYKKYFLAQASGKLPIQTGGMFGTLLTLDKALDWVNKFCNVVSPVQQVTERVKNELQNESLNEQDKHEESHKPKKISRKRSKKLHAHKLVKRFKKNE
jgi:hypothetical protein